MPRETARSLDTRSFRRRAIRLVLAVALTVSGAIAAPHPATAAPCYPTPVQTEGHFRSAIACFVGAGASAGETRVTLGSDIPVTLAALQTIDNPELGARFVVDGAGFTIRSEVDAGILHVALGTHVSFENLTLTHDWPTSAVSGRGLYNQGITVLTNVTIDANAGNGNGGGIYNTGTLTITDSTISNNEAVNPAADPPERSGGGIRNDGSLTITGTTISGNTGLNGAGLWNTTGSDATIRDSAISDNRAISSGGGIVNDATLLLDDTSVDQNFGISGGGIWNHDGAELELRSAVIDRNTARFGGGGIVNRGTLTSTDTYISGNTGGEDVGGGISAIGGTVNLTEVRIEGNTSLAGSAISTEGSRVIIDRSSIVDNGAVFLDGTPTGGGGAIRQFGGELEVVNTTIDGNTGGAISSISGSFDLTYVTITRNTNGRGVVIGAGGPFEIEASIIAENAGGDLYVEGGSTVSSRGYNVLGSIVGSGSLTANPTDVRDVANAELGALETAGEGGTRARIPDLGSPAVDLVPPSGRPRVDQFGTDRPEGAAADAGAIERDADLDGDGVTDLVDNCPSVANPGQADRDGDGIGDECDVTNDASAFQTFAPLRYADSRDESTFDGDFLNTGPRAAGTSWEIQIVGRGPVRTGAAAAIVNLTVLNGDRPGFATVYPCTDEVPDASSVNYAPGGVEPNEVIAKLSPDGTICVFTLSTADVIIDVVGTVGDRSPYRPLEPRRYADSRDESTFDGRFVNTGVRRSGTVWEIPVAGRGGVPDDAVSVAANVTVTGGTGPGFATVYPCTPEVPEGSSLNYGVDVTRPNEVVTRLSSDGSICVFTLTDVNVIVDVVGYLERTSSYTAIAPTRYADSRAEPTFDGKQRDTGIRRGGTVWNIPIAGRGRVPSTAEIATVNLTVTGGTGPGFATVYPCTPEVPDASSLNYRLGITRPNEVIATLSSTGSICVFTLADTHVIVDVVGHG